MSESNCGCRCSCSSSNVKDAIKELYGNAALSVGNNCTASCCGGTSKDAITKDLYTQSEVTGIPIDAILASLGCANPIALAELKPGEVVLDLGSGGGIDVLLSAKRVGPTGMAFGLDMTDEMLALANKNKAESGLENVEFIKGEIENIPLPNNSVDVIISNCVINLSTDKDKVLNEAFRVLKPNGRFAVADIVITKELPAEVKADLSLWASCIAGALEINDYKQKLKNSGFANIEIEIVRTYSIEAAEGLIPQALVSKLSKESLEQIMSSFASAFVRASKPISKCCCG